MAQLLGVKVRNHSLTTQPLSFRCLSDTPTSKLRWERLEPLHGNKAPKMTQSSFFHRVLGNFETVSLRLCNFSSQQCTEYLLLEVIYNYRSKHSMYGPCTTILTGSTQCHNGHIQLINYVVMIRPDKHTNIPTCATYSNA